MTRSDVGRRLPFVVALGVVLGLLALGVATSQLAASRAGDDVLEETAPFLTDEGLATMRADIATIDEVVGQMAADPTFRSKVAGDPALSEAALRLPEVRASAEKVVANLEEHQGDYESAADLPGLGLDLHQAVLGTLVLLAVALLAAVAGVFRPGRAAAGVVLGVGVLLAAVPLGLGHVGKAHDTDALLDSLRPFSVEKVEAREAGLADALLVAGAYDGTSVPAQDLAALDDALDRFTDLVALSRAAQPLLVDATEVSASTTVGTSIGAGAALAAAGAVGLITARRSAPRGTTPERQ